MESNGNGFYEHVAQGLKFGNATELAMSEGFIIYRIGWNDNDGVAVDDLPRMYVIYVPESRVIIKENTPYGDAGLAGKEITIHGHFDLKTPAGTVQPGWLASQADIQATDWVVCELKS